MATPWEVPKLWPGATVAIIATGASASREVVESLIGRCPIIAVNDAFRLAPEADLLHSCDSKWWEFHAEAALKFAGIKTTLDASCPFADVMLLKNLGTSGLSDDPAGVFTGNNSTFQATNIAVLAGATRVMLFGVDMKGPHFFGDHPEHMRDSDPGVFGRAFIPEFEKLAPIAIERGVDIVNCAPGSAMQCFRFSTADAEFGRAKKARRA